MADVDYSTLTYAEIRDIYLANLAMSTIDQCNRVIGSVLALQYYRPSEHEHAGERISNRELESAKSEAKVQRGILRQCAALPVSYVPPDALRGR